MEKQNRNFIRFWDRIRRINKWRFIIPVGFFSGLGIFGLWQLIRIGEQDIALFLLELVAAILLGVFCLGRLAWLYNEKKFIRKLRQLNSPLFN
ncbi:hypothetical protein GCM10009118_09400 [Wandonia haliotis]|uniref:Uncharacterized protein n=1 Tax=Wandonia haliotis TaxID=574963 RepID=A0ABN1MMR2_9FLAO